MKRPTYAVLEAQLQSHTMANQRYQNEINTLTDKVNYLVSQQKLYTQTIRGIEMMTTQMAQISRVSMEQR